MITNTDIESWMGPTFVTAIITDVQITYCLNSANRYCNGFMQSRGVSGSGDAYDTAVECMARANVCMLMDNMGIKPTSFQTDGNSQGADPLGSFDQWHSIADMQLENAYLMAVSNRTQAYIYHVRGNQGAPR